MRQADTADPARQRRLMLDIIIVSYNCREALDGCLHSLATAPPRGPHRIVVVDNHSTDGTPAHVRANHPSVQLIDAGGNVGFAAANNMGIRATGGGLVLLLNPDTVVTPGALDRLRDALESVTRAGVAGPRIVDGGGRAELSFGHMLSPLSELRQKVLVVGSDRGVGWVLRAVDRMTRQPQRPDWVSGACLLIRRDVLEHAGLLDERFFMYTEDVDLCAAVRAQGRDILFVPEAEIVHLRGRSRVTVPAAARHAYRRSHVAFYEKHHPGWAAILKWYLRLRGEWPVPES
jgi:N-acetylglucosaminyl-diphospho-decaprenol L-rhamnosyltransferase